MSVIEALLELSGVGCAGVAVKGEIFLGCIAGWMDNCESMLEAEIRGVPAGLEVARKLQLPRVETV